MTRRARTILAVVWLALALATLVLVIRDRDALAAALTAWTGGLVTQALIADHRGR